MDIPHTYIMCVSSFVVNINYPISINGMCFRMGSNGSNIYGLTTAQIVLALQFSFWFDTICHFFSAMRWTVAFFRSACNFLFLPPCPLSSQHLPSAFSIPLLSAVLSNRRTPTARLPLYADISLCFYLSAGLYPPISHFPISGKISIVCYLICWYKTRIFTHHTAQLTLLLYLIAVGRFFFTRLPTMGVVIELIHIDLI